MKENLKVGNFSVSSPAFEVPGRRMPEIRVTGASNNREKQSSDFARRVDVSNDAKLQEENGTARLL